MRNTYRLPKSLPEGTKYVVESAGQFVRRFVELPNGRKNSVANSKGAAMRLRGTDQHRA